MQTTASKRISSGARVYYVDVRTDKNRHPYITLTEVSTKKEERRRVFVYPSDLQNIINALQEAQRQIEQQWQDSYNTKATSL